MLRSILLGVVAGARSMTPLAVVAREASRRALPENDLPVRLLGSRPVRAGAAAMAAAELAGDKLKSAPDRIVLLGLTARLCSAAIVGAAVMPAEQRALGAAVAVAAALGASYLTFELRMRALRRYGRARSGLVEDVVAVGGALAVAKLLRA